MNHANSAQPRDLKNDDDDDEDDDDDDGVSNNFARFATVSSVNSMSARLSGCLCLNRTRLESL